jgi:hypothetical protein
MSDGTFDEVRPRTPRSAALQREKIVMAEMAKLLAFADENALKATLETVYGIMPGTQRFEDVLSVWRELSALQ